MHIIKSSILVNSHRSIFKSRVLTPPPRCDLSTNSQLSYSRYWEGISTFGAVTSNWTSAAAHALSFVKDTPLGRRSFAMSAQEAAKKGGTLEADQFLNDTTEADINQNATFYHDVLHLVSLLHALVRPSTSN